MPLDINLKKLESDLLESRNPKQLILTKLLQEQLNKEMLIALLSHNQNAINHYITRFLVGMGLLTKEDLERCGIDSEFIKLLDEEDPIDPSSGSDYRKIETIEPGATEVYFWGIPGSGKSCALGAVMSIAHNGNDRVIQQPCQGGDYMSRLSQIFTMDGAYTFLPAGTAIMNTYEMRFSLIRDKKEHPLALIDMSGELFRCLYKQYTKVQLNNDEQFAFDTLKRLLVEHASQNRKIHFFVIEYGAEDKFIEGLRQSVYLQRAAEYLNHIGVFDNYTDAIYIILTKADKAGEFINREDEDNHFRNYMSKNYSGFYWALQEMCEKHSINGGSLEFVPFTIGEICFQRFCHFNSLSAREILDYIIERSFYIECNKIGQIVKVLRK